MVKSLARLLALSIVCVGAVTPVAADSFETILKRAGLKDQTYGIEVRELLSGKVVHSVHADRGFNPASSIKVLTAATTLSTLGPNYRFKTAVLKSGKDLCLKGYGDPSLVSETMWLLVEEARRRGVQTIEGDLIADTTLFPISRDHIDEFKGDESRAFTAPLSPLSVNFNSLTIYIKPTEIGEPASVTIDPDLSLFDLRSQVRTATSGGKGDISANIKPSGGKLTVNVTGKIARGTAKPIALYRSVPWPDLYTAHLFLEHLQRAGGLLRGKIRNASCSSEATELFQFESSPLSQIIFGMNKFSNNFIADMLLRAIGNQPTVESGIEAMKKWLKVREISAPELILENGSGLSRVTRVSAQTLVSIVRKAALDLTIGPEFLSSLGIAGIDGTMHRRKMNGTPQGSVRAKSGSISGVVSMTGVVQTQEGKQLAYAFIFNGFSGRTQWDLLQLEDNLLAALISSNKR